MNASNLNLPFRHDFSQALDVRFGCFVTSHNDATCFFPPETSVKMDATFHADWSVRTIFLPKDFWFLTSLALKSPSLHSYLKWRSPLGFQRHDRAPFEECFVTGNKNPVGTEKNILKFGFRKANHGLQDQIYFIMTVSGQQV